MPYVLPAVGSEFEPTMTAASENSAAEHLGFAHDATAHDGKGRLYRVRYDFWISQDCCTLAVIGGGSIASIPVDAVWLWSRTVSGEILCTTNAIGEQDISGIVQQETWPAKALLGLCDEHEDRLRKNRTIAFPIDEPLRGHFEIRRAIADALVERGYSYYVSEERMAWRYTILGALVFYVVAKWLRPMGRCLRSCSLRRGG